MSILRTLSADHWAAEAYRTLLAGVELDGAEGAPKTLLVTSTIPKEGRTTISIGLAICGAFAGRRVLLIDGELRRPAIHRILGLDNRVGFADLILGQTPPEKAIQPIEDGDLPQTAWSAAHSIQLNVITSGVATPEALHALGSPRTRDVLRHLALDHDLVLVDSPPALALLDAVLLSNAVDGTVFVLGAGCVQDFEARRAVRALEQAGARIVGAVLNTFDESAEGGLLYPYEGSYRGRD